MAVFTTLTAITAWGVFDETSPMAVAWEKSGAGGLWRKSFEGETKQNYN